MREVRNEEWAAFCDRLNAFENGATVSLEWIDHAGGSKEIARQDAFEGMDIGKNDACNDRISIRNRQTQHDIIEPIHVKLQETEGGAAFNTVFIEAEEGTAILTFHPVIRAAWLQDLHLD